MKALKIIIALIVVLSLTVPVMAHNGKGPGGKGDGSNDTPPVIPDTGELYGDLYVILRDEDGVPIFDENLCIQPISTVDASVDIDTIEGTLTIDAQAGEPFSLATYTDTAGDLVECELTEEMATWVETVDFGRLNLGRAPVNVIAHAFDEAIIKMNSATAMYLDPAGRLVLTLPDTETEDPYDTVDKTIDAPAENLALYIAMMTDGDWYTEDTTPIVHGGLPTGKGPPEGDGPSALPRPVLNSSAITKLTALGFENLGDPIDSAGAGDLNNNELLLAASLLAAAADKAGSISTDMVIYINFIYGINQLGTLSDGILVDGKTYFDFGAFTYNRSGVYAARTSGGCAAGWVWVLQPELDASTPVINHFVAQCMDLLGWLADPAYNGVQFIDMVEQYQTLVDENGINLAYNFTDNVRGFAQASDDALQVIEYIHNYKIPEVLYP
jgi:hypothetical protein